MSLLKLLAVNAQREVGCSEKIHVNLESAVFEISLRLHRKKADCYEIAEYLARKYAPLKKKQKQENNWVNV